MEMICSEPISRSLRFFAPKFKSKPFIDVSPKNIQHFGYVLPKLMVDDHFPNIFEGILEVKLPTIWTDEKQRWKEKVSEERRSRCPKRQESRETLRFSDDLWVPRVEK
jgi:hypothetical protein